MQQGLERQPVLWHANGKFVLFVHELHEVRRNMRRTMRRTIPSPSPSPALTPTCTLTLTSILRSRTHSWSRECRPSAAGRTRAIPTSSLCTGCHSGARCTQRTLRLLGGRVDGWTGGRGDGGTGVWGWRGWRGWVGGWMLGRVDRSVGSAGVLWAG